MTDSASRVAHGARPARLALVALLGAALLSASYVGTAQAAITKAYKPGSTITLSPGIDYSVGTMRTTGGRRQSVRVATVQPEHPAVRLRALLSNDLVVKREVVSAIAKRFSKPGMLAMVATNGDMSQRDAVDAYAAPQGMHVAGGELMLAQACTRPTLGVDGDGVARIGDVRIHLEMNVPGLRDPRRIGRMNTHRDDATLVLFTKKFAPSTRTKPGGIEVVLELSDKIGPSDTQDVEVRNIKRGAGNSKLRAGQAVLSMKGNGNKWVNRLRVGQRLELVTRVVRNVNGRCGGKIEEASGWEGTVEAAGGNHFTLRNGRIAAPSRALYSSGSQRHPRTGTGVTADGRVLMITVDGRQSSSAGVTLAEMGGLMKSLGARHAFNMDGGGSTNMGRRYLDSGVFKVANRPSDGGERPATQALGAFHYDP